MEETDTAGIGKHAADRRCDPVFEKIRVREE
jgi:hypothetical protein